MQHWPGYPPIVSHMTIVPPAYTIYVQPTTPWLQPQLSRRAVRDARRREGEAQRRRQVRGFAPGSALRVGACCCLSVNVCILYGCASNIGASAD